MPDEETSASPDDADDDAAPPRRFLSSIFTPRSSGKLTDPELRAKMRTLDPQERRLGLIGVPLALVVTLLTLRKVAVSLRIAQPVKGSNGKLSCSHLHGSTLVGKLCEVPVLGHPSDYQLIFSLGLVLSAVLLVGTLRSMRTLVIFTSLFIGLFAGIPGILFLFYGGWLVLRSWRLQRFGAKDAATARRKSIERSAERKEQRRAKATAAADGTAGKPVIQPSKRYTPKTKPRRR
jgi:hypothetical protein